MLIYFLFFPFELSVLILLFQKSKRTKVRRPLGYIEVLCFVSVNIMRNYKFGCLATLKLGLLMFNLPSANTQEMFSLSFSLFPASRVKKL